MSLSGLTLYSQYCNVVHGGGGLRRGGRDVIDRNKFESLADALASVEDLDKVKAALIREQVIRQCVAETGETREIVVEMIDAMDSMGQEAVTALTDGDPTTLREALLRYVEQLPEAVKEMTGEVTDRIVGDLGNILAYPFPAELPAEPARVVQERPDVTRLLVSVTWRAPRGQFYYHPSERVSLLETWIESALTDRDDAPEATVEDLGARDVEVVRRGDGLSPKLIEAAGRWKELTTESPVPAGPVCGHGAPVASVDPSAFEGADPVRTYTDGCQSYGPYPTEK
jgi:hypothetical protein